MKTRPITAAHWASLAWAFGAVAFLMSLAFVLEFTLSADGRLAALTQDQVALERDTTDARALARTRELVQIALPAANSTLRFFQQHLAGLEPSDSLRADLLKSGSALVDDARVRIAVANGSALGLTLTNEEQERSARSVSRALERLGTSTALLDRFFRDYGERGSAVAVQNLHGLAPWMTTESMGENIRALHDWLDAGTGRCAVAIGPGCESGREAAPNINARAQVFIARLWTSPIAAIYCAWFVLFTIHSLRARRNGGDPGAPATGLAA